MGAITVDSEHQHDAAAPATPVVPADPLPAEIAFLELGGLVDRAALVQAAAVAHAAGVTADRALLAAGVLSAERFYRLLADHLGVAFLDRPLPVADHVAIDGVMQVEIVPLAPNAAGVDYALAPRGEVLARLLHRFAPQTRGAPPPRVALTTPRRLAALIRRRHAPTIVRDAAQGLSEWNPRLSARGGWTLGQRIFGFLLGFSIAVGLGIEPLSTFEAVCLALSALFAAMVAVRLLATVASQPRPETPLPSPPRRRDETLPVYTVVVPLFREARVVPKLMAALMRLDYPAAKLDIKLVLEADDHDTLEAVQAERLPDCFEVLLAPAGHPRTKPRALNIALRFALGRYLVIYDAEDEPQSGQLREAVDAFAGAGPDLGCVQARLAIDNTHDSWLTRLFTVEYAALFDVLNPGLARLGLPIALGGTSNHFRIEALQRVNGWDAWNVTEDADLGIRLARFGYRVGMLRSTTFEEAPNTLNAWLGQRQRWQKGWMVTLQTHSRAPGRLFAQLGVGGATAILALLLGTVASALVGPIFAVTLLVDAAYGPLLAPHTTGERAWSALALVVAVFGLLSMIWPALLGMKRRGLGRHGAWLLLLPAYLGLLSLATWRALFEMAGRPYSWTKTEHGLAKRRDRHG